VCAGRRGDGIAARTEAGSKLIGSRTLPCGTFQLFRKLAQTSSPELRNLALN
jgi:hypothetical protein